MSNFEKDILTKQEIISERTEKDRKTIKLFLEKFRTGILNDVFQKLNKYLLSNKIESYNQILTISRKGDENDYFYNDIIHTHLFPNIDFGKDKEKVLKELNKYIENPKDIDSVLNSIAIFLSRKLKYDFFLALSLNWSKKALDKSKVSQADVDFIKKYLKNNPIPDNKDKYFQLINKGLESNNLKHIKIVFTKYFYKMTDNNQQYFKDIFNNISSDFKGETMSEHISNATISDILNTDNSVFCMHVALITKRLFNAAYKGKNAYMMYINNKDMQHAYNVILIKKNGKIKYKYIDMQNVLFGYDFDIDYGEHKYEFWGENNISYNNIKIA